MYTAILHATDLAANHYDLCKKAVSLANKLGAKLYLLHVIELPTSCYVAQGLGFAELAQPIKDDATTVMRILGDSLKIPPEQQYIETGSAKGQIITKLRDLSCDLLLIGSHTPGTFPTFIGSTAHALMQHAPCDVLTLRVDESKME